ncbi:CBS-domain-containing protein [Gonapodya prolifera JEL478]|uniref:CBS-domain-containing protein n=1 Tax=Gonapodya prolifera (strain JEL478) TaxID=1344416 RepID=A0A139AAV2_GONPJ|nr:CBS-domain-containing protein [Gonapodya prolifera JEL478]|eukprot:KXS13877.1 CBS-domain-containing protein [Gonapodya prolifera JEL478]
MDSHSHPGLSSKTSWWTEPVGSLVKGQKVTTVDSETTIEAATVQLAKADVSSAPIFDQNQNQYVGSLDWADVAAYLLIVLKKGQPPNLSENGSLEIQELIQRAHSFQPVPARLAADLSSRNPLWNVTPDSTIVDVLGAFSKGIHRVCVMGPSGLEGVLSQSALAQYLYRNSEQFAELKPVLSKTLAELGLGKQGNVVSVEESTTVVEAIKLMVESKVSAVPIIGKSGRILGNVSQSDIRYVILNRKVPLLYTSVLQFAHFLDQQLGMMTGQDRMPVFELPSTSTLALTVAKLSAVKCHRIWVVDHGRVAGVVSFTDVLRALAAAVPQNSM